MRRARANGKNGPKRHILTHGIVRPHAQPPPGRHGSAWNARSARFSTGDFSGTVSCPAARPCA